MSTWLITGCSTGLGRAFAEAALDAGHDVVVTARDLAAVTPLTDRYPGSALPVALDVTDDRRSLPRCERRSSGSVPSTS